MSETPKYKLLNIFLIVFIFILTINLINSKEPPVVDNSPYPEFIYIDNKILPEVSKIYIDENIPSFLFYPIDGIYIDGEDSGGMAVKTPLWYVVKLFKVLNLFSEELESIHPENGFLFINSEYKGTPKKDHRGKYIVKDYDDLIVYLNDSTLCAKFDGNNRAYFIIAVSKDRIPYKENEDEESVVDLINGLKSINGIKVNRSKAKIEGDMVVIDMVLEAGVSDIEKLMDLNLSYVPITVKVRGDWIREDEDRYSRDSDYIIIYTPPLDRKTTLNMLKKREELDINLKKKIREYHYQGWYIEEYQNTSEGGIKKQYICTKELEYGTVCVVTNRLENLEDIEIYEES